MVGCDAVASDGEDEEVQYSSYSPAEEVQY